MERFQLSNDKVKELAQTFGTPLYVLSEAALRLRFQQYRSAMAQLWQNIELSYASKANGTLAVLQIATDEGYCIDVASPGELLAARRAGVAPKRIHLHGNGKSNSDLELALSHGVGQIIVDSIEEVQCLSQMNLRSTKLLLRLNPGILPTTDMKISTSGVTSKFGLGIFNGDAEKAVQLCKQHQLPLVGYHFHIGSMIRDPLEISSAAHDALDFGLQMRERHRQPLAVLNLGGGIAVQQTDDLPPIDLHQFLILSLQSLCDRLQREAPEIQLAREPGRFISGESGVTLYEVQSTKTQGNELFVTVDGGLSDNPSPSLYNRRFDVLLAHNDTENQICTVVGSHCESDVLFPNVSLPKSIKRGDILQVLCTGAYNSSMASNYNRFRRPATVLILSSGEPLLVQERESWDEILLRERLIPKGDTI